ncbi:MAG TPA: hypothetical protein VFE33_26340 [Thermoanaerobaculia bacterium]|nr:hypothetical protein [Thermoanaerobaculia bacterium]
MKRILSGIYQLSPLEGFQIHVSGPVDPIASLEGRTLDIKAGQTVKVTPDMLNGMNANHLLFLDLVFLGDDPGKYDINILDDGGQQIESIPVDGPDVPGGESAQVQLKFRVEAEALAAKVAAMRAHHGAQRRKP